MGFVKFFLKHSLTLNLITILLLVVSTYKALDMRLEAFPSVDFDIVTIQTRYPGASPKEVEQYVTDIIEDEIENISGISDITSTSIENVSLVVIKLDPDRSDRQKSSTINEIQRSMDRVRNLPEEVSEAPLVKEVESGDFPVVELGLSGDLSYRILHEIAEDLADRIRKLPDAKDTRKNGFREKEFWVEVDPKLLRKSYISLSSVTRGLAANNMTLPGGTLRTPEKDYLVRTTGQVTSKEDIENLVLRNNDSDVSLRIKDIGTTTDTFKEQSKIFRMNGKPSINLLILKNSSGDIINLVRDVKKIVEEFKKTSPYGEKLQTSMVNDMSIFVERRLGVLLNNGFFGILLVLGSLLIFLSPGIALVAAMGMPVAFLGAILVMSMIGMTINLITMFALVIVLGMLVDDAIIVAENIWQHYENGASPWDATVEGTSEVFWPVTATILTTIAAFSPLLMVSGIFGKFIASMPKVVIVALLISLIEAMVILPTHALDVIKRAERRRKRRLKSDMKSSQSKDSSQATAQPVHAERSGVNRLVHSANEFYGKLLSTTLRYRYVFLICILGVLGGTLKFSRDNMHFVLFPSEGIEAFFIRGELPHGTKLEDTSHRMQILETVVRNKIPSSEIRDFSTVIGVHENDANDPLKTRGPNLGQIGVFLVPETERGRTANQIIEDLRQVVTNAAKSAGFTKTVFSVIRRGPPVGKPVAIRVAGKSLTDLEAVADLIQLKLTKIQGVKDISENFLPGKSEVQIVVDEAAASKALLSVRAVALHVRAMLEGEIATYVRTDGERIAVRVRYKEADRKKLSSIENSRLTNSRGIRVPLRTVVHFERTEGVNAIIHKNGVRTITITAAINEATTTSILVNKQINPVLTKIRQDHPALSITSGGEYEETNDSISSLIAAFGIAMAIIFLILATQFSSLTQPFVVMIAIPFGIIGVIISFYLHGIPLSFLGMIGMIGLSGVVVNDSIVMVDFINKARNKGLDAFESCVNSGKRRFRAVLLTSITTVFGLLPMVYGIGGTDHFLRPAAMALGYGLIFATVLVLFFIPSLYLIRIDLLAILDKIFNKKSNA